MAEAREHRIERVRRETRRRSLNVVGVVDLTPRMRRITFFGVSLQDFESAAPDDHVKLFFSDSTTGEQVMRDFTPRSFDNYGRTLTIDFALHGAGPASDWARGAKPGDRLEIGGPRGSMVVADDFDWYLLAGDETALPAIARRLEELRPGVEVHCFLLSDDVTSRLPLTAVANAHVTWLLRNELGKDDRATLLDALRAWTPPPGDGFVFIAAEAGVTQAAKEAILARGHNPQWMKASGYWVREGG